MGGPTLQAFIQLRDNASSKLKAFMGNLNAASKAAGNLNTKLNQMGSGPAANKLLGQQSALRMAIAKTTKEYHDQLEAHRKMEASMQRQGMSTGRLITMMVKFGIILKALQLITAPLGLVSMGVSDIMTTDRGVRNIMGMLAKAGDTPEMLTARYKQLTKASRDLQISHGLMADDIVKGEYKIASVISTIKWQTMFSNQAEAVTFLTKRAADLAVGGFLPLEDASSGLATVLAATHIDIAHTNDLLDIMFTTVQIGALEMKDLTAQAGDFLGILGALSPSDQAGKLKFLSESMAIFGYLTTQLPPGESATAMKRMLQMAASATPEGIQMGRELSALTGGKTKFGGAAFANLGPKEYFTNILKTAGPQSPFLKDFLTKRYGREPTAAESIGVSTAVLDRLFGDSRALVGVLAMANSEMEGINAAWAQMEEKQGSAKRAADQGFQSFDKKMDLLRGNLSVMSQEMLDSNVFGFFNLVDEMNKGFSDVRGREDFTNMTGDQKMGALLDRMTPAFQKAGEQMGEGFIKIVVGVGGRMIGGRGVGELIGDAMANPIARSAGTFFGLLGLGVPWPLAIALAAGAGATAMTDSSGKPLLGPVQSTIFTALAGFASLAFGIGIVQNVFKKLVATFLASKGIMSGLFRPIAAGWRATNQLVPSGGYPTGAASAWPRPGQVVRGPGGRFVQNAGAPGMYIPGVGYMAPPKWGPFGKGNPPPSAAGAGWNTNRAGVPFQNPLAGRGLGGAAGRALGPLGRMGGGVGGMFGNAIVFTLVGEAINQIFETIQLISDNWDTFVYALKTNKLGDILFFGALFSAVKNLMTLIELWNNAPWNQPGKVAPPPNATPGPNIPTPDPNTGLYPGMGRYDPRIPSTPSGPGAGYLPPGYNPRNIPVPQSYDSQGRVVSARGNTTITFAPVIDVGKTDNPRDVAARVIDELVLILDEASGNSGDMSARSILT